MRAVRPALLAVALASAVSAACELSGAGPRVSATDIWERTYELGTTPTLQIHNTNGAVTVHAHDEARIVVRAERTARAATEHGAQQLLEATSIAERVDATSLSLTTRRPGSFSMGQQAEVRYDVTVPRGASLALRTTNGALTIDGVEGLITLESVNGRVRGTGLGQVQRAETVNGSVRLALERLPDGGATFETVNGSVELALPSTTRASVAVRTVNGSIRVDGFADIEEGQGRRRRYDGQLNGGGPALRVETVNGSVTVRGAGDPP